MVKSCTPSPKYQSIFYQSFKMIGIIQLFSCQSLSVKCLTAGALKEFHRYLNHINPIFSDVMKVLHRCIFHYRTQQTHATVAVNAYSTVHTPYTVAVSYFTHVYWRILAAYNPLNRFLSWQKKVYFALLQMKSVQWFKGTRQLPVPGCGTDPWGQAERWCHADKDMQ